MDKGIAEATDNLYMYKFRTNICSERRRCSNPAGCFDAHSKLMKRRVPIQVKSNGGLFNYIPKICPEWQKSKKCPFGENCPRSHGWLEVIFHPLLYKTKLCKAPRRNGVCSEYDVYCAKAHMRSEIRSLVEIYGEKWKRHYDIEDRLRPVVKKRSKRAAAIKRKTYGTEIGRVGRAEQPKQRYRINVNLFAQSLLNGEISENEEPPMYLENQPKKSKAAIRDGTEFWEDNRKVTSYTQLYQSDPTSEKEVEERIPKGKVSGAELQIEGRLPSTLLPCKVGPEVASTLEISLLPKELESNLSTNGIDWGTNLYYDTDNSGSDTSNILSDRAIGELPKDGI